MTLANLALVAVLTLLSFSSTQVNAAQADVLTSAQPESISAAPDHRRYRQWQCSAHSTHDEHHIYWGDVSPDRYEAIDTAIHECEHHTRHECEQHTCSATY